MPARAPLHARACPLLTVAPCAASRGLCVWCAACCCCMLLLLCLCVWCAVCCCMVCAAAAVCCCCCMLLLLPQVGPKDVVYSLKHAYLTWVAPKVEPYVEQYMGAVAGKAKEE